MVDSRAQAKALVVQRKVHLAAGLIPVSAEERPALRYGPSYSMLQAQVIYLSGNPRPRTIDDLIGATIETPAGGIGESELSRLTQTADAIRWTMPRGSSVEQMLARANAGVIDYAIVPSYPRRGLLILRPNPPTRISFYPAGSLSLPRAKPTSRQAGPCSVERGRDISEATG